MRPIDRMARSYMETAVWASTYDPDPNGNGQPLEDWGFSADDFSTEAKRTALRECGDFVRQALSQGISFEELAPTRLGHDFWLTRNRHGAGFWDGDYPDPLGQSLTDLAHSFGEAWVMIDREITKDDASAFLVFV